VADEFTMGESVGAETPRRGVVNQHANSSFKDKERDGVLQDGRTTVDLLLGFDFWPLLSTAPPTFGATISTRPILRQALRDLFGRGRNTRNVLRRNRDPIRLTSEWA
jgi:hypothetical protein